MKVSIKSYTDRDRFTLVGANKTATWSLPPITTDYKMPVIETQLDPTHCLIQNNSSCKAQRSLPERLFFYYYVFIEVWHQTRNRRVLSIFKNRNRPITNNKLLTYLYFVAKC